MRGLGILILIVVFFWLIWPMIARWLKRKAAEKAEDYMRSTMGMPPRDKSRKRNQGYEQRTDREYNPYGQQRGNHFRHEGGEEPLIPKEYAEDVEFVETKDYSSTTTYSETSKKKVETYHESQISDVEWTEIKSRSK